ncbi:nuclear transport factor 2 family protein, partial [Nocardioides dubius]
LMALYAEDAVKHEPLGVASHHGLDAIREFDIQSAATGFSVTRHSPITVSNHFSAVQVRVQFEGVPDFLATDLFEFDEHGKITSLSVLIDIEARA